MRISSNNKIYVMSPNAKPVQFVEPNSIITIETMDCYDGMVASEKNEENNIISGRINPATGPIYINGAECGDTLVVDIVDISIGDRGIMRISPAFGVLSEMVKESKFKIMKIADNKIYFNENYSLSVSPMIGVIGTAPRFEEIGNETPGDHGGNMDTRDITIGSKVYLPVNVEGGLLSLGDIHAAMGDGECSGTGVEVCGEVTIKVDIIKNTNQKRPYVETSDAFYTVCSAPTLEEASKLAVMDGVYMIMKKLNMDFEDAYMLSSIGCNLIISQIVDPLMTVRLEIPKTLLKIT